MEYIRDRKCYNWKIQAAVVFTAQTQSLCNTVHTVRYVLKSLDYIIVSRKGMCSAPAFYS